MLDFHLHPDVIALAAVLLGGYLYSLRRLGPLFHPRSGERAATGRQKASLVTAVASLVVALGWPIHDLGEHYLYSAHMVQHLLLGFVAPPLLLLGLPEWLGRLILGRGLVGRLYRRLARPLPAAIAFNAALALVHWPWVVDVMLASTVLHAVLHLVFIMSAVLMWSVLYSPLPELARLSPPAKMGYLFVQTILPTVPASFLTFGDQPLYRAYLAFPRLLGLSALEDMQLAGLIMKLGGGLLLWSIIAVMFFRWASREETAGPDSGGPDAPSDTPHEPSTSWS